MATINEILSSVSGAYTGGSDRVRWEEELKPILNNILGEILVRGLKKVSNTSELSAQSGADFKFVIVSDFGLFEFSSTGTANGTTIFPAFGGGVWIKILTVGAAPLVYEAGFAVDSDQLAAGIISVNEDDFTPQEISLIRDGDELKLQIDGVDGDPVYSAEKPVVLGGNTFGEKLNLGTLDNFGIGVLVNGVNRMDFNTNGRIDFPILSAQNVPVFSNELLTSSGWTSTGWTGSFASGWTHTPGTTTALTNTLAAGIGKRYNVSFVATGWTTGTITITFGGQTSQALAAVASGSFGPTATTTGTLSISPSSTFDGTLIVSIREIFDVSIPSVSFVDNTSTISGSMRFGLASLQNVSIGQGAGGYLTSGFRNSNFGTQAGGKLTSGTRNSNFGCNAGASITTGQNNVCVGDASGEVITSGIGNALFGQGSGSKITNGASNTGIGYLSLSSLTTGQRNSASGVQSLFSATSPNDNTAFGYYCLGAITTGANNTGIGALSGRFLADGSTLLTTPTNCVYVGSDTRSQTNGVTNENVFGYGAIGAGSNTVTIGNNSIASTYLKGSVAIGKTWTTSPPAINSSALFELESTSKGFLISRMTAVQAEAIASPAEGLLVYCNDGTGSTITTKGWWGYDGATWVKLN